MKDPDSRLAPVRYLDWQDHDAPTRAALGAELAELLEGKTDVVPAQVAALVERMEAEERAEAEDTKARQLERALEIVREAGFTVSSRDIGHNGGPRMADAAN